MEQKKDLTYDSYAIFETGGKQYQAVPGKTIAVEKLEAEDGKPLEFTSVLFRKTEKDKFEIGHPFVEGATIKASIVKQMRDDKKIIFKFKRRKKHRTKMGHRQSLTVIRIESI